jgi:hypothetical protein
MDIYAEMSLSMMKKIATGKTKLNFPDGVTVIGQERGRGLHLYCDDSMGDELKEFLDQNGINWQEE